MAVSTDGKREIIGLHIGPSETETFWATFLKSLVRRGLRGTKLVISDAHEGLKAAIMPSAVLVRGCGSVAFWRRWGYFPSMPFKPNAACRHRIPRARYRVTNWPAYEAGLRRRGDLTLWLDEAALAGWAAPKRSSPGGQPLYCELAIELVLTLRLVFHLALRQAEAFSRSVLCLLGAALPVPDHTALSRRSRAFADRQPRVSASAGPIHLVLRTRPHPAENQGQTQSAIAEQALARLPPQP